MPNEDSLKNKVLKCRPFLKWAGGKTQLLPELVKRLPKSWNRYFEPFVGGGALFFRLLPKSAFLSDITPELVNAYIVVRDEVEALITELSKHKHNETYFYRLRSVDADKSFKRWSNARKASRLIYLNKTCFNGLYRLNKAGCFNTPFGKYKNPKIVDPVNLRACSHALKNATISVSSFEKVYNFARRGDLVYFDPPYVPLDKTSSFVSYSRNGFDLALQKELFKLCCKLNERGVKFMLSNSSHSWVTETYSCFRLEQVKANRAINSVAKKRGKIEEVLVTNY